MKPAFKAIFFLFLFAAVFGSGGNGLAVSVVCAQEKKPALLGGDLQTSKRGEKSSVFKFKSGSDDSKKKRINVEESVARVKMENLRRAQNTKARTQEVQLAQMEYQKAYMDSHFQKAGQTQSPQTRKAVVQRPAGGDGKVPIGEIKSEKKSKAPFKFFKGDGN